MYDKIQKLFAKEPKAKAIGLKPGDFSFNSKGGCDFCKGMGNIEFNIGELGEIENSCPECDGNRFRNYVLEVTYKGKNIYDILEMSVSEGGYIFERQYYKFIRRTGESHMSK